MKTLLATLLAVIILQTAVAQSPKPAPNTLERLEVTVHPGIELFTIVQILAGQYRMPNKSTYAKAVETYFTPYANHPAVKHVKNMGRVYTDLAELGYCFDNFPDVRIHIPADSLNWYKYYGKDTVQTYMQLCKQFYDDTKFWNFYQQHQADYASWAKPVRENIAKQGLVAKLDSLYRERGNAAWSIYLDPLNGWGAHAIMTKTLNPRYANRVAYNVGFFNQDSKDTDTPVFDLGTESVMMVWHEGSHIYTNGWQRQHASEIEKLAYLLNKTDAGMKQNNIKTWSHCFDENLVRGVVIALFRQHRTPKEARKQAAKEIVGDFLYAEDIADVIGQQYLNNSTYADFGQFMPKILAYLAQKYPQPTVSTR
ncbi:MAG: DUF4932 domain-containing protein [Cytophagales bacterium]|nr:MAG: DUF4932 domain-containing protein [Cytophagales bacterium]